MGNREQLLRDIGIADFVLTELILFLDTHPDGVFQPLQQDKGPDGEGVFPEIFSSQYQAGRLQQGVEMGGGASALGRRVRLNVEL